ncbi:hypothetical protein MCANUF31_00393 [Mycoplasmopsis canis UF31]|uniref:hypothetical protein n=1 Tax=Mycoplasmopsis canis TaxID=29555 RepID=UPI00025ADC18|nr:hypothetical protein [Mycoplasmopsis canis]EIE40778.1 hypothetical protein MCANUF31_00393 [Mycoplasmopsis canis UF31]
MKKNKKIAIITSFLGLAPFVVLSCSNQQAQTIEQPKEKKNIEKKYNPNNDFINKLNIEKSKNQEQVSKEDYNVKFNEFVVKNVIKLQEGEKIESSKLPSEVIVFNSKGLYESKKVTWENVQDLYASNEMKISGSVEGSDNLRAFVEVITTPAFNSSDSEFTLLDDKLKINEAKTTKDGSKKGSSIFNLVDRSDSSESTGSVWHNWWVFNAKQNNIIAFNSDESINVNRLKLVFGKMGGQISTEAPAEVRIKYSNDGEEWFDVKNQDKVFASDFGPLGDHHEWRGSSKVFTINFSSVKAKWFSLTWKAPKNSSNQDMSIALTDLKWFGPYSSSGSIINNFDNTISAIQFGDSTINVDSNNISIKTNSFTNDFKVISNATFVQKELVFENSKFKTFKIIAFDDLSTKNIYTIKISKEDK